MARQSPMTRQQRRYQARQSEKRRCSLPPHKAKLMERLAFKAARQQFAEVGRILQDTAGDHAARVLAFRTLPPLRHRGKGRGTPARYYGNFPGSAIVPGGGLQERLRRLIGGWPMRRYDADLGRFVSSSKRETLARTGYARPDHAAHHLLTGDRLAATV